MNDQDQMLARLACESLITKYTHIADFGPGATMVDLFTEDGVWSSGNETYTGHAELQAFFGRDKGHAKSRHVASNMLVTLTGDDEAGEVAETLALPVHRGEAPGARPR